MESGPPPSTVPAPGPAPAPGRRRPPDAVLAGVAALVVVVVLAVGGIWVLPILTSRAASPPPSGGASASDAAIAPSAVATQGPSRAPSPAASRAAPTSTTLPGGPFGVTGSMAVLGNDGSLSLVEAGGRSIVLSPAAEASPTFPAWSPDGSRIAAIRTFPDGNAIVVYDAKAAAAGQPIEPVVILRSSTLAPFYLSWTPDGRAVSFLAEETSGLSLRLAPADGSAPLDGSGPGATLKTGNPLYFDWIDRDRLLAHVGTGPFAFVGEIGVGTASPAPPTLDKPGDFRPAVVSRDEKYVSYVRAGTDGASEVVVAARDGTTERTMPVFGTAAVTFDPMGDTVASIGPTAPPETAFVIPLGPLRLIDPSGTVRTLVDGRVVSFWWSPDGKTIAALRVQPVAGSEASAAPASSASPLPSPTPQPTEVRLLFVDVATGRIGTQHVVNPGQLFIDQFLTYFDQYALSHTIWAPDSSSVLIPIAATDGTTRIAVTYRNGDPPRQIDGVIGFWSP